MPTKVSQLTSKDVLDGTEILHVVSDPDGTPVDRKTTTQAIANLAGAPYRIGRVSAGSGLLTNLATGRESGLTSQYGSYSSYLISKTIDGLTGSGNGWIQNSGAIPGWWRIDLGTLRYIQQIKIYIQTAGMDGSNYMQRFSLEISGNATDWVTLYTSVADETPLTWLTPTITPTEGRFVRVNMTKVPAGAYPGFSEIQILAGGLNVYGLLPNQLVDFKSPEGIVLSSKRMTAGGDFAEISMYSFNEGYLVVYDPFDDETVLATSEVYTDLAAGDVFVFM